MIHSCFRLLLFNSIAHEYKEWSDKNPSLRTCNPSSKIIPGNHSPQEVDADKEVVFTYDVTFMVCALILSCFMPSKKSTLSDPCHTSSPVKSNGHHAGIPIFS